MPLRGNDVLVYHGDGAGFEGIFRKDLSEMSKEGGKEERAEEVADPGCYGRAEVLEWCAFAFQSGHDEPLKDQIRYTGMERRVMTHHMGYPVYNSAPTR